MDQSFLIKLEDLKGLSSELILIKDKIAYVQNLLQQLGARFSFWSPSSLPLSKPYTSRFNITEEKPILFIDIEIEDILDSKVSLIEEFLNCNVKFLSRPLN